MDWRMGYDAFAFIYSPMIGDQIWKKFCFKEFYLRLWRIILYSFFIDWAKKPIPSKDQPRPKLTHQHHFGIIIDRIPHNLSSFLKRGDALRVWKFMTEKLEFSSVQITSPRHWCCIWIPVKCSVPHRRRVMDTNKPCEWWLWILYCILHQHDFLS